MLFLLLISVVFLWRPYLILIGGRGEIKMASAAHHQLMRLQGPHFSPRSKGKANYKGRKLVTSGVCDVAIASVYFEKTCPKKIIMIIIMNLSQLTTVFGGRQKFTSAMKQSPVK